MTWRTRCSPWPLLPGLILAGWFVAIAPTRATVNVFSFDDPTNMAAWWLNGWGGQGSHSAWDGTQDHTGNGGGSLHVVDVWQDGDQLVDLGWWGGQAWNDNMPVDLTTYVNIRLYIKWDSANSTADLSVFQSTGEPLQLWAIPTLNLTNGFYNWIDLGPITIPASASNGWAAIDQVINTALPGLVTAQGLGLKKYTGTGFTNIFAFWVDDIGYWQSDHIVLPPTLSTEPAVSGLNLFALLNPMSRQSLLATQGPNSFVGRGSLPVTYSFTIKQGVDGSAGAQFQNHLFIVPTAGAPPAADETAPDWTEPNCIFLDIESATNSQSVATFRYKTNQPNTNSMMYDSRFVPAVITNAGLTGTWTLTVLDATNFSITAPLGSTTNFNIPSEAAQLFADPAYVYLGVQGNNWEAIDRCSILSEAKVTGTANAFDDCFTNDASINTNLWEVVAAYPPGVVLVPASALFWIRWTLPDVGFSLLTTASLNGGNWLNLTGVTPIRAGGARALIDRSLLPGPGGGYFALVQRKYTQLQVLLPGETNAPGTVSGKIGTPSAVSLAAGGTINVTVKACDPNR